VQSPDRCTAYRPFAQWEDYGWRKTNTDGGIRRVKYRMEGRHLCVVSVEIVERPEGPDGGRVGHRMRRPVALELDCNRNLTRGL